MQVCVRNGLTVAPTRRVRLAEFVEFEFGFGGSILSANRFPLPLVVALFFSTLASADSTSVTAAFLHSGAAADNRLNTNAGDFPTNAGKVIPMLGAFASHISAASNTNARIGAMVSGKLMDGNGNTNYEATRVFFTRRQYEPTCCEARRGIAVGQGRGMTTPEPGSLTLLSTGLMGIAGMVRRKLRLD